MKRTSATQRCPSQRFPPRMPTTEAGTSQALVTDSGRRRGLVGGPLRDVPPSMPFGVPALLRPRLPVALAGHTIPIPVSLRRNGALRQHAAPVLQPRDQRREGERERPGAEDTEGVHG